MQESQDKESAEDMQRLGNAIGKFQQVLDLSPEEFSLEQIHPPVEEEISTYCYLLVSLIGLCVLYFAISILILVLGFTIASSFEMELSTIGFAMLAIALAEIFAMIRGLQGERRVYEFFVGLAACALTMVYELKSGKGDYNEILLTLILDVICSVVAAFWVEGCGGLLAQIKELKYQSL